MKTFPPILKDITKASSSDEDDEYFDELYDENDCDNEDTRESRFVILHIASQLTRNMDISRLSLPASLCERRSILETYSDYFSRTNQWLDIAKEDCPERRMLACIKWYLSIFSASRKSKLARKPYNPILGEVFRCKFKVVSQNQETIVSYVSEQVSHHPPILAIHVEDDLKLMSFTCQIYLKTKFLGFSVSVDMIGEARLTLPQRDNEQYIITFPTAFCNSIYTTPWLELGGKTVVSCTSTGYEAKIHFKRQGYFLSHRDKVEATVFHSTQKNSICWVKGSWNGILTSKYDGESEEKLFLDIPAETLVKSIVQPRSRQLEFESRKVWESVTMALKHGDLRSAIEAKIKIEQDQRNKVAAMIVRNEDWTHRFFNKVGDIYEFINE